MINGYTPMDTTNDSNNSSTNSSSLSSSNYSVRSNKPKKASKKHDRSLRALKQVGEPMHAGIGYKINHIGNVDSITGTFECDFKVFVHWEDPEYIGTPEGTQLTKPSALDPVVDIINERSLTVLHAVGVVKNKETGEIKTSHYYRGKLQMMSMDLFMFPFDCQNLQICLRAHKRDISLVKLVPSKEKSMLTQPRHEWNVVGHCTKRYTTDPMDSSTKKVYSCLHIVVLTQREHGWYVNNILFPTTCLTLLSFIVFFFDTKDISGRMETAVSLVLAGIASKFTVGDKLPKVPYQTFIDRYQDSCFYHQMGITFTIPIVYLSHQIWAARFDFDVDDDDLYWKQGAGRGDNDWNREQLAKWVNIGLFVFMLSVFAWRNFAFINEIQRHWHEVSVWKSLGGMDSVENYPNPNTTYEVLKKLCLNERNEGGNRTKKDSGWPNYGGSGSNHDVRGGVVGGGEAMWTEQFVSELKQLNESELKSQSFRKKKSLSRGKGSLGRSFGKLSARNLLANRTKSVVNVNRFWRRGSRASTDSSIEEKVGESDPNNKSTGPSPSRHKGKHNAHAAHTLGFGVGGMALESAGNPSKIEEQREALPAAPTAPRPKASGSFVFPQSPGTTPKTSTGWGGGSGMENLEEDDTSVSAGPPNAVIGIGAEGSVGHERGGRELDGPTERNDEPDRTLSDVSEHPSEKGGDER